MSDEQENPVVQKVTSIIDVIFNTFVENGIDPHCMAIMLQHASSKFKSEPDVELALLRQAGYFLEEYKKGL